MVLTNDQKQALSGIIDFLYKPIESKDDACAILYAAAGCGKTYLTRVISDHVRDHFRIAGVAPTHKAKKVLGISLNTNAFIKIKTMTIASLLNKIRTHTYIGTKNYTRGLETKLSNFDLFLIDEASMITDNDADIIINTALEYSKKILFIGDKYQIPNPSQKFIVKGQIAHKRASKVFQLKNAFELCTIVRQTKDNPLIETYTEIRDALISETVPKIKRINNFINDQGIKFYNDKDSWNKALQERFSKLDSNKLCDVRIIAYTNDTVKNLNVLIRKILGYSIFPQIGDLLMGYNNLGWPEKIIENSQDYHIIAITETNNYTIFKWTNLVGKILIIKETDSNHKSTIFLPTISAHENKSILDELVRRAEIVNQPGSKIDAFKQYSNLKNQLVFMENIYKINGEILSESQFKTSHPLLCKPVSEVIIDKEDDRVILDNKLSKDLRSKYLTILDERIEDDKPLSGSEKLCDRYCVIEKDLDYGYCITAHKSQGSNFDVVFIDESDFDKLHDYWNYSIDCKVDSSKEKNQLLYVSYTRPKKAAHVYYRE